MTKATILNTRPLAQQKPTTKTFIDKGFKVIELPCIEIAASNNPTKATQQLISITEKEVIVFTSQYSVRYAYSLIDNLKFPSNCIIITVGTKTAHVLEQNFNGDIWTPKGQNSQGVIDLLRGLKNYKKINLITAADGRHKIQKFASENNIKLTQINVYQRKSAKFDKTKLAEIASITDLQILATSVVILTNLKNALEADTWQKLLNKQVICASKRIAIAAKTLGFKHLLNVNSTNPDIIVDKI